MSAADLNIPGVVLGTWFKGRGAAIVPGSSGAEDLAVLVPLVEPISAGRPPVPPQLVASLELEIAPASAACGSGERATRAGAQGTLWGGRCVIEVSWPALEQADWDLLRAWLLDAVAGPAIGGAGGSLRAMTIDVDGPSGGTAAEVRMLGTAEGVHELIERVVERDGVYRFGPVKCEEVL